MANSLTQIIDILKPGEVRLIRNFYRIQSNGEIKQRLKLFDLIKTKGVTDDQQACKIIYDCPPNSAYSHLKARLQKDILSLLLVQEGSKRYETPYAQAVFDCRRMIIEGQMLIERGAYDIGVKVLTKADKLAKKYELYNEDVTIADILRSHLGIKRGLKAYNKYNADIEQMADKMIKLLQSRDYYHRLMVPNLFQKNREQHFSDYSVDALAQLGKYYKETRSGKIGFYYWHLKVYHHQIHKEMPLALDAAQSLLKLLEKTPAIHSNSRVASANFQIAAISAYMGKYADAFKSATKAHSMAVKGLMNELAALEMMFLTAFQAGKYKEAQTIVNKAKAHPKIKANKLIPAKWDYYQAYLLFVSGKYEEASRMLWNYNELYKDKAGWLLGLRILELMCMVQQDELEIMDFRTESFRKLIQRQKSENVQRVKDMVKVMESYVRQGGNKEKTLKKEARRLSLLRSGEGNYQWDPLGFELIRFDEWFDNLAV